MIFHDHFKKQVSQYVLTFTSILKWQGSYYSYFITTFGGVGLATIGLVDCGPCFESAPVISINNFFSDLMPRWQHNRKPLKLQVVFSMRLSSTIAPIPYPPSQSSHLRLPEIIRDPESGNLDRNLTLPVLPLFTNGPSLRLPRVNVLRSGARLSPHRLTHFLDSTLRLAP